MNIIVGATGQIGSRLIREINRFGSPIRAVVRNPEKLLDKSIEFHAADLLNLEQVIKAFQGGSTVFVLTPENPASEDIIGDTKHIVENYREAIQRTGIQKVIALSCIGAHIEGNTGNILMSGILEKGLEDLEVEKVIIRPSYFFSNWLAYLESVEQHGILPTFFPDNLKIDMHSPEDLASFIAKVWNAESNLEKKQIFEVTGPRKYSSLDLANILSELVHKRITVQSIPQEQWKDTLKSIGFTENTASNLSDMTRAVIEGQAVAEFPTEAIKLPTTLESYLAQYLKK